MAKTPSLDNVQRTHVAALRLFREGRADLAALAIARSAIILRDLLPKDSAARQRLLDLFPGAVQIDPGEDFPGGEPLAWFFQTLDLVEAGIREIQQQMWPNRLAAFLTRGWAGRKTVTLSGVVLLSAVAGVMIFRSAHGRREIQGLKAEIFSNPIFQGPAEKRIVKNLSFKSVDEIHPANPVIKTDGFSIRFTGFVYVPHEGVYEFSMMEDDAAALWIDGLSVLDSRVERNGKKRIQLKAGFHPIRVEYVQWTGGGCLYIYWQADGGEKKLLDNLFVHPEPALSK